MKKLTVPIFFGAAFILGTVQIKAQDVTIIVAKNMNIQRYTLLERFEPDLVYSFAKRTAMKEKRLAQVRKIAYMLDTMGVAKTRKEKLLRDMIRSPFAKHVNKAIADIKFGEED